MSVQGVLQHLRVYVSPASSAVAPSGGTLFDLGSENTTGGVAAIGTIVLSAMTGGTANITVGGVEITDGEVAFDTNVNDSATAIAADITSFTSSPNYTATASTGSIIITAALEGTEPNGLPIVITGSTDAAGTSTLMGATTAGAGDGIALGGITYLNKTTNAHVSTIPTTVPFQVIYKDMLGRVFFSPTINPGEIISTDLARAAVSPTEQVSNLTIGTATAGASYVARLVVPGYGGLLGAQDEVYFYGSYTAKTGDAVGDIATALGASLKKAVDNAPQAFAAVTVNTATITVTGLAQPYVQAKWSGRQVNFALSLASPEALLAGDDGDTTTPILGNGNYNQVASMEEFYAGYNEGYKNRYSDFPYNTEPLLAAEVGEQYTSDTVTYATTQQSANLGSQRQVIKLFFKE